jgi:histidinol-phosphate/aromatic aminotransferase/cobyric acid decarboxylase-like protein
MSYVRPEIAAIDGYTPGEQPQAGKFIKLNTNENPYAPSPAVRRAVEEVLTRGLQKYPDPMANAFRTRAAELFGLPGRDWILCGNGSDDILTICTRAFIGPGELLRLPYLYPLSHTGSASRRAVGRSSIQYRLVAARNFRSPCRRAEAGVCAES